MAEAIWELEREEQEMEGIRNGERRRAHAEATGPGLLALNIAEEDEGMQARAAETAERQRSEQREQEDRGDQQAQSAGRRPTGQPQVVNAGTNANDGETSAMGKATQ